MKKIIVLLVFCLCFNRIFCMQTYDDVFKQSIVGETYSKLSEQHLVGKFLSETEIENAKNMQCLKELKDWKKKIKPLECDVLFYIGMVLNKINKSNLAADMIFYAYENGQKENWIIYEIEQKQKAVTKKEILSILKSN